MSKYVDEIMHMESKETSDDSLNRHLQVFAVVDASTEIPKGTDSLEAIKDESINESSLDDDFSVYSKPRKVLVKKYRLKK